MPNALKGRRQGATRGAHAGCVITPFQGWGGLGASDYWGRWPRRFSRAPSGRNITRQNRHAPMESVPHPLPNGRRRMEDPPTPTRDSLGLPWVPKSKEVTSVRPAPCEAALSPHSPSPGARRAGRPPWGDVGVRLPTVYWNVIPPSDPRGHRTNLKGTRPLTSTPYVH